ncbi:uncharacterized protein N7477_008463 [Penicillium maclennaniae]|uniref:uncharacterized protein n=1 Tax=Penicillium maclennaniae TaxID=1343394 RepID=UPI002542238E|nr:uncharacterized protein N7477_008463 [Penicillium maclennaniae]KAJ5666015.1 hypothetical protein N7477_008463 [Penicillium maclennaniae]
MAAVSPPSSGKKPMVPRFNTNCCGDQHSRDSSPSSCGTPDGSSSRRPSFGSIKEDVDGIAQSFVDTQQHTPSQKEPRKLDLPEMQQTPDFCWAWETTDSGRELKAPQVPPVVEQELPPSPPPGTSALEQLPPEVLDQIISLLALDVPPNGYTPRNVDLISCLLASRTLHAATLSVLYRNMTFPHSGVFAKALNHMSQYPALGTLVRRLDFSHFTNVGFSRSRQMNAEIQNLTSRTLMQCLDLLPNLKECLLQEHLEGDFSVDILRKLFMDLPNLRALDFCGCATQAFSQKITEALTGGPPLPMSMPNLQRLSFHECSTIPAPLFDTLLSRLTNLTHLDLTHTQVNDSALFAIPETARITHLSVSRCTRLRPSALVEFLTTHPAVRDSLVFLNLMTDPTRFRLLEEDDVTALLPRLPRTLRSLNLGGAKVTSDHAPLLVPLTKHLEELSLASADISVADVNSFFARTRQTESGAEESLPPSTLCYLDLTKVSSMTIASIFNTNTCSLLSDQSYPLQVVEFVDRIINPLRERAKTQRVSVGWTVRELGRRGWYVRDRWSVPNEPIDDGSRSWKMGARWWGMRKIPMAIGDVGGIYGHYMFKK